MNRKQLLKGTKDKKITISALVMIAILAIFSFSNIVDNYTGMGLSSTVAFIIAIFVYLLPFSFVIAEMASLSLGTKSGLTKWIELSIGRKTAFITSFMFWFANLFYFVGSVPTRINYLSFAFTGQDFTSDPTYNLILPFVSILFFAIITWISTLNTKRISRITSFGGKILIGITLLFFFFAIVGWIAGSINPDLLKNSDDLITAANIANLDIWGNSGGLNFAWISTFIWVLMAADGAQSLGVYVNDVKGGKKAFSKGIIWSIIFIGIIYVLGTTLITVFPPKSLEGNHGLSNNLFIAFDNMFYFILNPMGIPNGVITKITYVLIGILFFIATLGGILVWTSAPVRTMFSEIPAGVFGSKLAKENKYGAPVFGSWIQFLFVVPFLLIPAFGLKDLNEFFGFIKNAGGWIGMIPPLIIFIAYFNLRWKRDYLDRSFKFGNRYFGMTIAVLMTIIFLGIMLIDIISGFNFNEPFDQWEPNWFLPLIYRLLALLLVVIPVYLWYYFRFERQLRDTRVCKKYNLDYKKILKKYCWNKKLVMFFNNEIYIDKTNKINSIIAYYDTVFHKIKDDIDYNLVLINDKNNEIIEIKKQYKDLKNNNDILNLVNNLKLEINKLKKENIELKKQYLFNVRKEKKEIRDIKSDFAKNQKKYLNEYKIDSKNYYQNYFLPVLNENIKSINLEEIDVQIKNDVCEEINIKDYENNINFALNAAKKYGYFAKKDISGKIWIDNKINFIYEADGIWKKDTFNFEDTALVLREKTKNLSVKIFGSEHVLNQIDIVNIKDNNLYYDSIYVENGREFVESFNKMRSYYVEQI